MIPTSNHNRSWTEDFIDQVVYLLIPTSNHNKGCVWNISCNVVYLLIPTSNHNSGNEIVGKERLYIFWFLHQTTTLIQSWTSSGSCISFDSYIKPQLWSASWLDTRVVYLLIPTSNHNSRVVARLPLPLYIFWFLHQTTTRLHHPCLSPGCISFDSYIKPQLKLVFVSSLRVVYLLIPTSNHNSSCSMWKSSMLYIFWFLHQTTTCKGRSNALRSCISFDSYIKPQPIIIYTNAIYVVYLLIPTSNHNL